MPAPDSSIDEYQAGGGSSSSDQVFTVLLIVAAAFFFVAIVFQYIEYSECYAAGAHQEAAPE